MAMQYEYRELGRHHIKTDELNELGKEGWEMIIALRMSGYFQMIFKRAVNAVNSVRDDKRLTALKDGKTPHPLAGVIAKRGRPKGSKNKVK